MTERFELVQKALLTMLEEKGEKETFAHIKAQLKPARKAKNRR